MYYIHRSSLCSALLSLTFPQSFLPCLFFYRISLLRTAWQISFRPFFSLLASCLAVSTALRLAVAIANTNAKCVRSLSGEIEFSRTERGREEGCYYWINARYYYYSYYSSVLCVYTYFLTTIIITTNCYYYFSSCNPLISLNSQPYLISHFPFISFFPVRSFTYSP